MLWWLRRASFRKTHVATEQARIVYVAKPLFSAPAGLLRSLRIGYLKTYKPKRFDYKCYDNFRGNI